MDNAERNADQPVQEHRCNDVETSVSEQNPDITPPLGKVNTDGDVGSCNACGQNCRYQIIEGRNTVHEDPEAWKRGLRNKDTVKDITRHSENINCATLPPVSACSIPAMTMEQKVDVNIINTRTSKNIVPLRDAKEHRNKLCMGVRALRIALFGSRKTASFAESDLGRRPGA
ncbi:hypothetical protein DTO271D3_1357 [Paecilomyces variotii]|nr:hypothetical protein DTO271D3_1357 [Paecilomyces variotii]